MSKVPRYIPATSKVLEALLVIVVDQQGIDIYHLVKAAYFADKYHLERYGRPIAGDSYQAAPYGPLAQVAYGLLKHDPIEMLALQTNGKLPFSVDERFHVYAQREANTRLLSRTDLEALVGGSAHVRGRSFDELYEETHADPAYANAMGGLMDYRDFIAEDDPQGDAKRSAIADSAALAVF